MRNKVDQVRPTKLNIGDTVLYSGYEEENAPHAAGVAPMSSHEACNTLISWGHQDQ